MKKTLIIALSIVLMLFAFSSCSNDNKGPAIDEPTAQGIAEKLNPNALVNEVFSLSEKDGVTVTYTLSADGQAQSSVMPKAAGYTLTALVEFDNYTNSSSVTIESGILKYVFKGSLNGSVFSAISYSISTEKELRISGSGIEEATDVTISVKETTPSSTVFNATLASTEAGETSIAAGSQVTVAVTLPDDNSDMTVGGQPVEIPSESEIPEPEPNPYGFAGGSGTSADPYLIANASQFLKIGTQEFQTKLLEGDNDNLYFKLTGDIDLSNQTGGYAIPVFSGTLDGNGHVIKGSNNLDFIFAYFFEDTTFKNFTIELAESSVTRLFSGPSLLAESSFSGFEKGTSSGATNIYVYDKDTITLTIDDVDYKAYEGSYYAVGDDNYALYVTGNVDVMNVYYDGKFDTDSYATCVTTTEEDYQNNYITYCINLSGCDVTGNYFGGFGGSGAAIYFGGQFYGAQVNISDCSFDGNLEGLNVALVVANASGCINDTTYGTKIEANNVTGSTITSFSGAGDLSYANSTDSISGVSGSYVKSTDKKNITVNSPTKNSVLSITDSSSGTDVATYQVKLFLPSMYWYKSVSDTSYVAQTNSNTFTINVAPEELATNEIYVAKVLSLTDAENLVDTVQEFSNINDWQDAANGLRYAFVQHDADWYMVIDYGSAIRMYSDHGLSDDISTFKYPGKVIVLARNSNNEIVGVSALTAIN